MYNLLFVGVIVMAIKLSVSLDPDTDHLFMFLGIFMTAGGTLMLIFVPKFLMVRSRDSISFFILRNCSLPSISHHRRLCATLTSTCRISTLLRRTAGARAPI